MTVGLATRGVVMPLIMIFDADGREAHADGTTVVTPPGMRVQPGVTYWEALFAVMVWWRNSCGRKTCEGNGEGHCAAADFCIGC